MEKGGDGAMSGADRGVCYCFDLDEINHMIERVAAGFPPAHAPIWMMDLSNALSELESRYRAGDHEGSANDLLHLRSRLLRCWRGVVRYGRQHGFHPLTVGWFLQYG